MTLKELTTAAEALFKEADKDNGGKLDEKELASAVLLLFPPPPGFGGSPGGAVRLTLDRDVAGAPASGWVVPARVEGRELLPGCCPPALSRAG